MRSRKYIPLLLTAAAAAFLLRLFVAFELGSINGGVNSVFTPSQATDLCTYMRLAEEIASGKYKGVFYYQPFYYAVFLPCIRLLFGAGVWQVIIIQSLLGGATAFLAGLAGALIFGRKAGIFSAWMTAVSVPLLLYAPFHQNETLQTFNITLIFYLALLAVCRKKKKYFFLTGLVFGIGILTRGNLWILLPAVLLAFLLAERRKFKALTGHLLLFFLPLLLVQLPFALHNSLELGRLSGPSTAADAVLGLGNTWEAPPGGRNTGLPAGPMEYPEAYHRAMAKTIEGLSLPRQMLEMLLKQPGAFLELQFRKLLLFWQSGEIPNNVSLYGEGEFSFVLRNMFPGSSAVLLALGAAGLMLFLPALFCRFKVKMILLYGFILLYWGAVAAFYILSRFRAPVIPLITVAGGGFLCAYLKSFKQGRGRFLNLTALLFAAVWLTSFAYDSYRSCESAVMRLVRPCGTILPAQKGYPETRFDHGPFSFGGWESRELSRGTLLEKIFTAPGQSVRWSLTASLPGLLVCRVPGGEARVIQLKKGMNEITLPLSGSRAQLEILSCPQGTAAILDHQRHYSRSLLNGLPLPGEWVARMDRP
ncbi:MAG: glycosyltransferase family 39 protein [Lentisphaeria bacterium]|nr:glycosyltransferase family 39 protein [Lentisphaeria bacterium]